MFTLATFTALLASSSLLLAVRADPTPTAPGPGDSFNEGQQCSITWTPDTTGTWKTMSIELMTGDNFNMVHLTTVVTLDGTDPTKTPYTYPCPEVTPNSAIYFYQFSTPGSTTKYWTTRFTIAGANGQTTPPTNATQPGGAAIPWGTGALVNPSSGTPPPGTTGSSVVVSGSSSGSSSISSSVSSPSLISVPSSSSSGLVTKTAGTPAATGGSTSTGTGSSAAVSPATSSTSGASSLEWGVVKSAVVALGLTAVGFVVML
ncbi:hypothetical protein JAAARDRAFT_55139 [Jaapia argillacea MUCL 33604]|uniref:Yeast cell wall synthesis Kre9/Knh1-like N-terminal domain-containing protein n=1 Tax=Jaapia argillacea MUCL 33604 TaxID=933084 RepID=A0A067Q425_9AGAM|nr:hypothetical protein JAAARDRAFT_55139 [Jaapia argillacea MUCL 33604]